MSKTSSPASSPQPTGPKSARACVCCRIKKKGCDKALPSCGRCKQASQPCLHEEDVVRSPSTSASVLALLAGRQLPSPITASLFSPISSAKDLHSLALTTVLDMFDNRQGLERAVSSYFAGVNTWFTIVERATFEKQLSETWQNPSAETCALALCMSMIARPPNPTPGSVVQDSVYQTAKSLLGLIQSSAPMSTQLLQAELLVSMYEFSHSLPQQAYLTLGRCFQMTKAFGWHNKLFWAVERKQSMPRELKLCSILWWSIVYVDGLLNIAYENQKYPMHTADSVLEAVIPCPESCDQYLPGSLVMHFDSTGKVIRDGNIDHIDGIVLPEASSALFLSRVLHPPTPSSMSVLDLSSAITQHTTDLVSGSWINGDRNAAVGTNFIALMKLNQPSLFTVGPMPVPDPNNVGLADTIRPIIKFIHDVAVGAARSEARLSAGTLAPCWGFAMYYASMLLITHGDGILQDTSWPRKVEDLKKSLEVFSKRWKIAEPYLGSINIALENCLTGYAI